MQELLPTPLQELLKNCNDSLEVTFDYDGREEGNLSRFSIYSSSFYKTELDVIFSYCHYPIVGYSKLKAKLCVEIDIEL